MASDWRDKLFGEVKFWFKKWLTDGGSKKISLLLTGKTGVGKSRLVNSLIGSKVAEEANDKDPCTMTVNCYRSTVSGIEIVVWDSPGLQEGRGCESDYLQDMLTKIEEVDLFIYCLKMDDTRLREEDLKAIEILTRVFGKKLLDNAVFALTFANKVKDPNADDDSPAASKEYFMKDLFKWEEAFRKHLPKAGIDASIVDKIPKVPTGNRKKLMLPDRENWLTEFWAQCYEKMKTGCRVNLLIVNKERINFMKTSPSDSSTASDISPTKEGQVKKTKGEDKLTKVYPDLDFTPSQKKKVEESTWDSFKEWVGDRWEGVKTIGEGVKSFFSWF